MKLIDGFIITSALRRSGRACQRQTNTYIYWIRVRVTVRRFGGLVLAAEDDDCVLGIASPMLRWGGWEADVSIVWLLGRRFKFCEVVSLG